MRVNIKPLSVNECFRGRRFKSEKYTIYQRNVLIKYSFNDKNIFKITIEKEIVKKKAEYIDFELLDYKENQ